MSPEAVTAYVAESVSFRTDVIGLDPTVPGCVAAEVREDGRIELVAADGDRFLATLTRLG